MDRWPEYLCAMVLTLIRVSGVIVFAPFFSSSALPARAKIVFAATLAFLLGPLVSSLPNSNSELRFASVVGELAVGLVYGLVLALLNEGLYPACNLQSSLCSLHLLFRPL